MAKMHTFRQGAYWAATRQVDPRSAAARRTTLTDGPGLLRALRHCEHERDTAFHDEDRDRWAAGAEVVAADILAAMEGE
jgi:hypothetical protein